MFHWGSRADDFKLNCESDVNKYVLKQFNQLNTNLYYIMWFNS